jgi:phosphatidylserine synthase
MFNLTDNKLRWLVYTVIFGMAPVLIRLVVSAFVVSRDGSEDIDKVSASDFIAFGIVLQVSIFNEIRYHDLSDIEWKHRMMGVSALFMLVYSSLYVLLLLSEVFSRINIDALLYVSIGFSAVSLLLCWAFYDRMTAASRLDLTLDGCRP